MDNKNELIKSEKVNPAFHLFLYLAMFFSLGFVIFGTIGILFSFIEESFSTDTRIFYQEYLRSAIAALVIATPIYYSILYVINKKLTKGEIKATSPIRKVITYIAVFIFFAMSIGSLVSLLNGYLSGELVKVSLFKTLAFLTISVLMLGFYFWEIRRTSFDKKNFNTFFLNSLFVALLVIVLGFVTVDSPSVTRKKNQDRDIINAMSSAKVRIDNFYANNERLMSSDEFNDIELNKEVEDKIKYNVLGDKDYELCSEFNYSSEEGYIYEYMKNEWRFPAGEHCFKLKVQSVGPIPEKVIR